LRALSPTSLFTALNISVDWAATTCDRRHRRGILPLAIWCPWRGYNSGPCEPGQCHLS
jgi:hypothetical protein